MKVFLKLKLISLALIGGATGVSVQYDDDCHPCAAIDYIGGVIIYLLGGLPEGVIEGKGGPVCGGRHSPNGIGWLGGDDQDVCCDFGCGQCGGTGCSGLPGGSASCCEGRIRRDGNPCSTHPPPCVVDFDKYAHTLPPHLVDQDDWTVDGVHQDQGVSPSGGDNDGRAEEKEEGAASEGSQSVHEELAALKEELEMKNRQITSLQKMRSLKKTRALLVAKDETIAALEKELAAARKATVEALADA